LKFRFLPGDILRSSRAQALLPSSLLGFLSVRFLIARARGFSSGLARDEFRAQKTQVPLLQCFLCPGPA
jgi:hypothetical protein